MAEEKVKLEDLVSQLKERFERHKIILTIGTKDPNWEDGSGANIVRNHMFYFKSKIEYFCEINKVELPSEYFWTVPDEVDPKYMARKNEILANAKKSLSLYENNDNYRYLLKVNTEVLDSGQKEILNNVLGYVKELIKSIEDLKYVEMRRHEDADRYLSSFSSLREKLGDVGIIEDKSYYSVDQIKNKIFLGDCLEQLKLIPEKSINCSVTSPPYWGLRDYEVDGQIGLEDTPEEYVEKIVSVFREVKRVLKDDGTLWLVIGDSYAGSGKGQWEYDKGQKELYVATKESPQCKIPKVPEGLKEKDLVGIPWMVAFALRADGWYLRKDIIWEKPNCMPEAVKDRPTSSFEYIFLLAKSKKYYYDFEVIMENCINGDANPPRGSEGVIGNLNNGKRGPGNWGIKPVGLPNESENRGTPSVAVAERREFRNKRSVWNIATAHNKEAHFATFPEKLIEPCILAGCPIDGIVLDPFIGSGTVAKVAIENGRNYLGIELNSKYIDLASNRIKEVQLKLC